MANGSSQARTMEQFVCGTPPRERQWQAHLPDTRLWSYLWHSLQMVGASSQARTIGKFVCGKPLQERQRQARLLDTRIRSRMWHYRQMVSALSHQYMDQFVC